MACHDRRRGTILTRIRTNLPSHQRAAQPPVLKLTARDKAVLASVYHYRVLTAHQIEVLHFPSNSPDTRTRRSACQRRLQKLFHHRYLARIIPPLVLGEGREVFSYALDTRGADEVARISGQDRATIGWKPKDNKLGPLFFQHMLAITEFRVSVDLLVAQDVLSEAQWVDEATLRVEPYLSKLPSHTKRNRTAYIIPDGYCQIRPQQDSNVAHFFLEVDRGTESNRVWADKMRAYRQFRDNGNSQEYFGTNKFRILALVSSERRLANLMRVTEHIDPGGYCWFALQDEVSVWRPMQVLAPIWRVIGEPHPIRLFRN